MVAPIISNDEVIGVFDLESDELNAYSNDDLEVLMLLASQVAIIIEKVMLHEQLIEKKRLRASWKWPARSSSSCLPAQDPEVPGYDISAYNFPTEEVSGDYYDWVRIYDDEIGIVIADVSGKGSAGGDPDGVSAIEFARGDAHRLRDERVARER
jgi:sigma-B regulation protein RsbU (phosphoserine phosphatase)